jgi:hypothetical protein
MDTVVNYTQLEELAKIHRLGITGSSGTFYQVEIMTARGILGIKPSPEGEMFRYRLITHDVLQGIKSHDNYSDMFHAPSGRWEEKVSDTHVSALANTMKDKQLIDEARSWLEVPMS